MLSLLFQFCVVQSFVQSVFTKKLDVANALEELVAFVITDGTAVGAEATFR